MRETYTYQDLEAAQDREKFIQGAINRHKASDEYKTAEDADLYDAQRNKTINDYIRVMFTASGNPVEDFTASNNKIASNFFNRLNTQRCMYSLGNGVSFVQPNEEQTGVDEVKEQLGDDFDHEVMEAAYHALIHGVSFVFWNIDRIHCFKLTEFVPLWDEHTGMLRAGIRFWRLSKSKPMTVVLYEEDGFTEYHTEGKGTRLFMSEEGKRAYKTTVSYTPADDTVEVVGEENYGTLPIVPMWASRLKQSTLVGMRSAIDSYDLIRSGFANDLTDCSMIYWIVENAGGMSQEELSKFRDTLKLQHIANVDTAGGGSVKPYAQEIPYGARDAYLKGIREGIYEDFGALDVHTVAAGATNDHIDAAYQPMDEEAQKFEYYVAKCLKQVLALAGIDDSPIFTRNRISNQKEQVEIVTMEAQWLDQATVLRKLPNIRPDEAAAILAGVQGEDMGRFGIEPDSGL